MKMGGRKKRDEWKDRKVRKMVEGMMVREKRKEGEGEKSNRKWRGEVMIEQKIKEIKKKLE